MNRRMLSAMRYKKVRMRPLARRVDEDGTELAQIDDLWVIQAASQNHLTLFNPRTHHSFAIGTDHVREFLTDYTGNTDGILKLKSQVVMRWKRVSIEPLD
jgi:hypothetical protein